MKMQDLNHFWRSEIEKMYQKGVKIKDIAKELDLSVYLVVNYLYRVSDVKKKRVEFVTNKERKIVKDLTDKGFTVRDIEKITGISYNHLRYIKYQVLRFTGVYT